MTIRNQQRLLAAVLLVFVLLSFAVGTPKPGWVGIVGVVVRALICGSFVTIIVDPPRRSND